MNKKRKLLIALMLAISGIYGNIYAQQSIYVEETDGSLTETPLTQVKKITFSGGDMLLHKTDASILTWATSDVQKYYYALTSNIEDLETQKSNDILIYPNPSNGYFSISYQLIEKGKVNIYIISIDGKTKINLLSENKEKGKYLLNISQYLEAGSYFIKVETRNNFSTKKIIIFK